MARSDHVEQRPAGPARAPWPRSPPAVDPAAGLVAGAARAVVGHRLPGLRRGSPRPGEARLSRQRRGSRIPPSPQPQPGGGGQAPPPPPQGWEQPPPPRGDSLDRPPAGGSHRPGGDSLDRPPAGGSRPSTAPDRRRPRRPAGDSARRVRFRVRAAPGWGPPGPPGSSRTRLRSRSSMEPAPTSSEAGDRAATPAGRRGAARGCAELHPQRSPHDPGTGSDPGCWRRRHPDGRLVGITDRPRSRGRRLRGRPAGGAVVRDVAAAHREPRPGGAGHRHGPVPGGGQRSVHRARRRCGPRVGR